MHSQQGIYRPHSILLVILKAHGKKPSTCRIKSSTSTVFLKVLTEDTVLWFSKVYTCIENNIFRFINFLPVFMCTICVPGVHSLEEEVVTPELESQVIVNVGAENQIHIISKSNKWSQQ